MLNAFKQLVEGGVISEQVRSEVESAFTQKIQENRDQVTSMLREEFAQKYAHDKHVMVEALDAMISDRLTAEMVEFAEDKRALAETTAKYARKMTADTTMMESFVANRLAHEVTEFQNDRKSVSENIQRLEQFIVHALAREISEFAEDKRDLAETKVKLVAGAKAQFNEVKKRFIKRSAAAVQEAVGKTLRVEITQLREDIESARTNSFGRRIFEAYAQEFQHSFLNEKSDTAKLLKIVDKKEAQIAEAKIALAKAKTITESKDRELRVQKDLMERATVMGELLAPLNADKKDVMKSLLESVQTGKLHAAYDKYLPAVMEGDTRKSKAKAKTVIAESVEVTGDRASTVADTVIDNILDIRKLAGLK